jgi:UDP-N-acetyl-D-galactosamine dehydrogenase
MGNWVADRIHTRRQSRTGSILVLGLTFKEDVPDLRNSKVADVISRLRWLGHDITVHDPLADPDEAAEEYGLTIDQDALDRRYDVVLAAVPHGQYRAMPSAAVEALVNEGGLIADLHGIWRQASFADSLDRWSL